MVDKIKVIDPDHVPETLCNGEIYLAFQGSGESALAVLTFTNNRPDAAPMFESNTIVDLAVVRARIVMNMPSLIALRNLLANVKTAIDLAPAGGVGSTDKN